jgi:hypothetical protein
MNNMGTFFGGKMSPKNGLKWQISLKDLPIPGEFI